ncbi:MAG: hypothetical protein ACXVA7_22840 [Isosphaeraceae bacterium]
MFQMIFGFTVSQIVRIVALYSLAEHLARGPASAGTRDVRFRGGRDAPSRP